MAQYIVWLSFLFRMICLFTSHLFSHVIQMNAYALLYDHHACKKVAHQQNTQDKAEEHSFTSIFMDHGVLFSWMNELVCIITMWYWLNSTRIYIFCRIVHTNVIRGIPKNESTRSRHWGNGRHRVADGYKPGSARIWRGDSWQVWMNEWINQASKQSVYSLMVWWILYMYVHVYTHM